MAPIGKGDGMDLEALIGRAKQGDLDAFVGGIDEVRARAVRLSIGEHP